MHLVYISLILLASFIGNASCFVNKFRVKSPATSGILYSRLKITGDQEKEAYEAWLELFGWMKTSAPNFLTKQECSENFKNLAETIKSVNDALNIIKVDPTVLNYKKDRVTESYNAWLTKFDDNHDRLQELILRNPPILSLSEVAITACGPPEIAQTLFWSYFAVMTRPLTLGIQKIFVR